jgi:hypothetical protein
MKRSRFFAWSVSSVHNIQTENVSFNFGTIQIKRNSLGTRNKDERPLDFVQIFRSSAIGVSHLSQLTKGNDCINGRHNRDYDGRCGGSVISATKTELKKPLNHLRPLRWLAIIAGCALVVPCRAASQWNSNGTE